MPPEQIAVLISAVFMPERSDDIGHPLVLACVGKRLTWALQGTNRGAPYDGQGAWMPVGVDGFPGWVPDVDLKDRQVVLTATPETNFRTNPEKKRKLIRP